MKPPRPAPQNAGYLPGGPAICLQFRGLWLQHPKLQTYRTAAPRTGRQGHRVPAAGKKSPQTGQPPVPRAPQPRHTGTFFIWNEHMIHQGFRGARISKISYEAAPLTTGRSRITALTRHPGSSNRAVRAGPPPATAASSPPPAGAPPAWHVSDPGHIGTHYILERSLSVPNCSRSCIRPGPAASAATAGAEVQVVAHKRVEGEGSLDLVPFWKPPKSTERMMRITISSRTHSRQPPTRDRGQRRRWSRDLSISMCMPRHSAICRAGRII